ncbi:hypothetical protein GCM10009587_25450 [Microbacterium maritypicum]
MLNLAIPMMLSATATSTLPTIEAMTRNAVPAGWETVFPVGIGRRYERRPPRRVGPKCPLRRGVVLRYDAPAQVACSAGQTSATSMKVSRSPSADIVTTPMSPACTKMEG